MAAKTVAELQNSLVLVGQAETANTVALVSAVVDERMGIHELDFQKIETAVGVINDVLDGDKDNEGFQKFLALIARVTTLEAKNIEQQTLLTNLLNLVNTEVAKLTTAIDDLKTSFKTGLDALAVRVTTLEDNATKASAERLLKDNEHDGKIATLEQTASNTVKALGDETVARATADKVNADAIKVQGDRSDQIEAKAETFVSRDERSANEIAAAQAKIDLTWAGRVRPAGLPNADGSVSQ